MFIVYVVQVLVSFDASKVRDHLNTVLYGCHPPHMNTPLTYNIIDKHTVMKCAYLKRCKVQCRLGCGEPPPPLPNNKATHTVPACGQTDHCLSTVSAVEATACQ